MRTTKSNEQIAKELRALRGNVSRDEVASSIGVSPSAIAMYENGERVPRDEIKVALARYYGKTVGEIFFDNE